jgi:hypothetical protein
MSDDDQFGRNLEKDSLFEGELSLYGDDAPVP